MEKIIFWDFDGTLAKPNDRFEAGVCLALRRYGYEVDYLEASRFLKSVYPWEHPSESYPQETASWWERFFASLAPFYRQLGVSEGDYDKINRAYQERIRTHNDYFLYDDTKAVLQKSVSLGYRNYILSNNYPELQGIVEALGIAEYFCGMVVSGCVGYEKPRKELFAHAKAQAECGADCQIFMVGDNPTADILGAKAMGWTTVFVHKSCANEADFACATLDEAIEKIASL